MSVAYVDTSCIAAIALQENGYKQLARDLLRYDELFASNLLEAELRSTLRRERITADPAGLLGPFTWVYPDRALTPEFSEILEIAFIRGADLWHLANALFISPDRRIDFLTLDTRQREISLRLGFGPTAKDLR